VFESLLKYVLEIPAFVFAAAFAAQWGSARLGDSFRRRRRSFQEVERKDLDIVLTASLTLLGLIIGFSFSMAISRYDQRKTYEEAEANAIGTEYLRAGLLPAAESAKLRELLGKYIDQRVLFYTTRGERELQKIETGTRQLQSELWSTVKAAATAQPTPILALSVAGMNDAINAEGYTHSSWSNRIPLAAWGLMAAIAVFCNLLLGYVSHKPGSLLFVVLPLAVSISFFLIAEIDSPRGGAIRVFPQNLMRLAESLDGKQ
jgi:hypothetical protein